MQPSGSIQDINPTSLLRRLLTNRKAKVEGWLIAFEGDDSEGVVALEFFEGLVGGSGRSSPSCPSASCC